ncbi:MAG: Gfo/Idh/MocA family oxidoreductase [Candidatus Aenigmatarchaeota archaeon]
MKVGLIGLGYWGNNYLKILKNLGYEVETYDPKFNSSSDHLKNCSHIIIASPAESHYIWVEKFIKHSHILLEKPPVLSLRQLDDIVKWSSKYQKNVFVGLTYLYNDYVKWIKQKVFTEKMFGNVRYIFSQRLNLGPVRTISPTLDLSIHDVSMILYWLLGKPINNVRKIEEKDFSYISFKIDDICCCVFSSWFYGEKIRQVSMIADQGMIVFDDVQKKIVLKRFPKNVNLYLLENQFLPPIEISEVRLQCEEPLVNQVKEFFKYCEKFSLDSLEFSYQVLKLLL